MTPEMHVDDIFRLSDGQTVFTGLVVGHPGRITACRCELKLGEETRQFVNIAGESIPKKLIQSDRRSISTFEEVNLSQEEAQSGKWRIILDIDSSAVRQMTYTKHDFVDGLKAEVAGGLDVVAVSRWAYRMFLEHIRTLEDGLKPAIMQIVAMEEGPEFEMTLEELLAFADALLGER